MPRGSRAGIARERQVRRLLEAEGWLTCRAAGSFGDADVWAMKRDHPSKLVEVKSTKAGPYAGFGPADRAELSAAAAISGAEAWLCWWPPRAKPRWYAESEWPKIR